MTKAKKNATFLRKRLKELNKAITRSKDSNIAAALDGAALKLPLDIWLLFIWRSNEWNRACAAVTATMSANSGKRGSNSSIESGNGSEYQSTNIVRKDCPNLPSLVADSWVEVNERWEDGYLVYLRSLATLSMDSGSPGSESMDSLDHSSSTCIIPSRVMVQVAPELGSDDSMMILYVDCSPDAKTDNAGLGLELADSTDERFGSAFLRNYYVSFDGNDGTPVGSCITDLLELVPEVLSDMSSRDDGFSKWSEVLLTRAEAKARGV
ncbi:hypothetical protein HDU76_006748 [Blyttiomyces sp. JEL0837]|nr:hypothetical protein HDU76_006748 [Blyttiomyces sp. JEL0837]